MVAPPHGATRAAAVVEAVLGWLDEGAAPADVAVLARVNALLLAPQVALGEAGIPVRSVLRPEVLERTGLRAALAYLRLATAPDGRIAADDLVEVLRRPSRGLPQWFADRFRRRRRGPSASCGAVAGTVPDKDGARVERLVDELGRARRPPAGHPAPRPPVLLRVIHDDIGLGGAMGLLDDPRGGEGSSHLDDLEAPGQVAALHPDVGAFETWLRRRRWQARRRRPRESRCRPCTG